MNRVNQNLDHLAYSSVEGGSNGGKSDTGGGEGSGTGIWGTSFP